MASSMAEKHSDLFIMPTKSPSIEKLRHQLVWIHGFHPRPEQVEAIKTLAID
jgi:hypothetical protein